MSPELMSSQNYFIYDQYGSNTMDTFGPVGLIAMPGSQDFVRKINGHLFQRRLEYLESNPEWLTKYPGFMRESYTIDTNCIRFSTGEGKAMLGSTVRGHDLYLVTDFLNHAVTYQQFEQEVCMSPSRSRP